MGQNVERLGRLQANRTSFGVVTMQNVQAKQRTSVESAITSVSENVDRAVRTEGFGGKLGDAINIRLSSIVAELEAVSEYHKTLGKMVELANQALHETASRMDGLPAPGLTSAQQSTIDMADKTGSPVQVSPGVTMTPAQAQQHYADQAEIEQEEAARKMTVALDRRLQEIIDGMPTSKYDPSKHKDDSKADDGTGGGPTTGVPGVNGGGAGNGSGSVTGGPGGQYQGPQVTHISGPKGPGQPEPPHYVVEPPPRHPPYYPPPNPEYPWPPETTGPEGPPNVDGGDGGTVPGGPGGPGGPRVVTPGGPTPGGIGGTPPGGLGSVIGGTAGGVGGAALASGLGRAGGLGAVGGLGGMQGMSGASGAAGAPGASGVVAQSGAAGGRGGMMAGGGAAGGGGGGDKRRRRRGQDLFAFSVDPEEDGVDPDLGAAGSAGSSTSDGREELGW